MSFAIPQPFDGNKKYSENLQDAVDQADNADIVQLCSHHDEGWNISKSWPADCGKPTIIAACNEYGAFTDRQPREYNYQLHGIDIFTGAVPYLESKDTMSGSSVATAIAAGLASLVLSCHRLQSFKEPHRRRVIKEAFDSMSVSSGNGDQKYLRLENFSRFLKDKNGKLIFDWFEGL